MIEVVCIGGVVTTHSIRVNLQEVYSEKGLTPFLRENGGRKDNGVERDKKFLSLQGIVLGSVTVDRTVLVCFNFVIRVSLGGSKWRVDLSRVRSILPHSSFSLNFI